MRSDGRFVEHMTWDEVARRIDDLDEQASAFLAALTNVAGPVRSASR